MRFGEPVRIAEQLREGEGTDVVERLLPVLARYLGESLFDGRLPTALFLQVRVFLQDLVLGRLKHAIEPAQHDQRQHDLAVLRRPIGPRSLLAMFQIKSASF